MTVGFAHGMRFSDVLEERCSAKTLWYAAGCGTVFKAQQCPENAMETGISQQDPAEMASEITTAPLSQELKIHDSSSQFSCAEPQNSWG